MTAWWLGLLVIVAAAFLVGRVMIGFLRWVHLPVVILLALLAAGCGESSNAVESKRFEVLCNENHGVGTRVRVLKDTKTGKQYLFVDYGNHGIAVIPMEDKQP